MIEITRELKRLNIVELDRTMRQALGDKFYGLATGREMRYILRDDITPDDIAALDAIYDSHDPTMTDDEELEQRQLDRVAVKERLQKVALSDNPTVKDIAPLLKDVIELLKD